MYIMLLRGFYKNFFLANKLAICARMISYQRRTMKPYATGVVLICSEKRKRDCGGEICPGLRFTPYGCQMTRSVRQRNVGLFLHYMDLSNRINFKITLWETFELHTVVFMFTQEIALYLVIQLTDGQVNSWSVQRSVLGYA